MELSIWYCLSRAKVTHHHILIQHVVVGLTGDSQTGNVQQIYHYMYSILMWHSVSPWWQSLSIKMFQYALHCLLWQCAHTINNSLLSFVTYKWLMQYRYFLSMTEEPKTYAIKKLEANVILSRSPPLPFLPPPSLLPLPLLPFSLPPSLPPYLPPVTWFLEGHWSCQYRRNKDEVELLVSHSVCVWM